MFKIQFEILFHLYKILVKGTRPINLTIVIGLAYINLDDVRNMNNNEEEIKECNEIKKTDFFRNSLLKII